MSDPDDHTDVTSPSRPALLATHVLISTVSNADIVLGQQRRVLRSQQEILIVGRGSSTVHKSILNNMSNNFNLLNN